MKTSRGLIILNGKGGGGGCELRTCFLNYYVVSVDDESYKNFRSLKETGNVIQLILVGCTSIVQAPRVSDKLTT